ncbi:sulfatase-like hydrolase/transferase [Lutibacter sp. B1]|nr:sulfatase-like hydrolase/transferase [Lutibacter sp. B1]
MKFKSQAIDIYTCFYLTISLIIVFWVTSLFEFYMIKDQYEQTTYFISIVSRLVNDFFTGLLIGLILFPVYSLVSVINKKAGKYLIKFLFALIVIINVSLVKYSLTTLLNLGADLLGYSNKDIYTTIKSSEAFSLAYFLPFIIFPLLLFSIFYFLKKFISKNISIISAIILFIGFGIFKLTSHSYHTQDSNKIAYLVNDVYKFKKEKNELNSYLFSKRTDYPLLKPFNETEDVLAPFFKIANEKPNIIIIIVEGLGAEFVGSGSYGGFTPYLDSLMSKSLYWENFVSNAGRTFGVLPSILGSLPYGDKGFLELEKVPSHISLLSVLKANNYTTSFITGDRAEFDNKNRFLENNQTDIIIDESNFGKDFIKTEKNIDGFSWGYADEQIFEKTLTTFDAKKQPRFDVIMTLSNHEPFEFPEKESFIQKVDSLVQTNHSLKISDNEITSYKDIFATLLYTDTSIKNFMERYSQRPEYTNTIFIITGDHRLIPVPQKDKLCRFHVPLYIFSPMLTKTSKFKSVSSHWDVAPSLLSFLMKNYKFNKLEETSWMGKGLDTAVKYRNLKKIPLMKYKGGINDYIYKEYLLSDDELYKIDESFNTYKIEDTIVLSELKDSLKAFKKLNAYITLNDKIYPDLMNIYIKKKVEFTKDELLTIKNLADGLNNDQTFLVARELAFNKEYNKALLLCNYILNIQSDHPDVRLLKGRINAWQGNYNEAELEFLNALKRHPSYDEIYLALFDLYWWSNQDNKSIEIYKKATENEVTNSEVSYKLAKAYERMNDTLKAQKIMDSIIKIYPENIEYLNHNQSLE